MQFTGKRTVHIVLLTEEENNLKSRFKMLNSIGRHEWVHLQSQIKLKRNAVITGIATQKDATPKKQKLNRAVKWEKSRVPHDV